jgi:hypothetical protein
MIKIEILFSRMYCYAVFPQRYEYEMTTTTTTTTTTNVTMAMAMGLLFHDAEIEDGVPCDAYCGVNCECDECCFRTRQLRWEAEVQRAHCEEQYAWGTCLECGIGLDDENEFLVDRRIKMCDCFTCDKCFEKCF